MTYSKRGALYEDFQFGPLCFRISHYTQSVDIIGFRKLRRSISAFGYDDLNSEIIEALAEVFPRPLADRIGVVEALCVLPQPIREEIELFIPCEWN